MWHWTKVIFILLLTLLIMRLLSWTPIWIMGKVASLTRWKSILLFNGVALSFFVLFLKWQTMPGEPFDTAALFFGIVIYGVFTMVDLYWLPWDCQQS
jgi:hypothetical protein